MELWIYVILPLTVIKCYDVEEAPYCYICTFKCERRTSSFISFLSTKYPADDIYNNCQCHLNGIELDVFCEFLLPNNSQLLSLRMKRYLRKVPRAILVENCDYESDIPETEENRQNQIVEVATGIIVLTTTVCYKNAFITHYRENMDIPDMKKFRRKKRQSTESQDGELGYSHVVLNADLKRCTYEECNYGNFATDAFVKYVTFHTQESIVWSNATIGMAPGAMFTKTIDATKNKGMITTQDVEESLLENFELYICWMKGNTVRDALSESVSSHLSHIQVSGVRFVYARDLIDPVVSIEVRCEACKDNRLVYLPLVDTQIYKVVLPSYLLEERGGRFQMLRRGSVNIILLEKKSTEVIQWYIKKYNPVMSVIEGRILGFFSVSLNTTSAIFIKYCIFVLSLLLIVIQFTE